MREKHSREPRPIHYVLKFIGSLIVLGILLCLGNLTVRFCLGLFMEGDYVVTLPGQESPVLEATEPPKPGNGDSEDSNAVSITYQADITVGGDLMMHMPIVNSGKAGSDYSFDYIFSYIKPYISKADYAVVNLETTLPGTGKYTGSPNFASPDSIVSGAKSGGIDLLLTGNNHMNDYGTDALLRTLQIIKGNGMDTLGTTATAEEANYLVKDISGIKVGMLNYTFAEIGEDPDRPTLNDMPVDAAGAGLINVFDYDRLERFYTEMEQNIAAMKADGAEAIVLFIHWGDNLSTTVTADQTAMAQKLCDLGVDVIAGSHPNVVQALDLLTSTVDSAHKTICAYSLGNFLSNQRHNNISLTTGHTEDGILLNFSLVKYSDGTVGIDTVTVQPTWILVRGTGDNRTYHILPLDHSVSDWKTSYELTGEQLEEATKSYNRTNILIGEGLNKIQAYLSEQKTTREITFNAAEGVG